ncbi:hypothetical protein HanXRQr2_Chr05g0231991 [Helianthus annuus]|uniref:Uncharacterized protein n=1 Tax=Helianthus annuus TaxID=4232 RepID=A0A9K3NNK9_HELAN|nr:hypothetical protein HanXRQr2_Chr05g0231991 [Helianthus annuus]
MERLCNLSSVVIAFTGNALQQHGGLQANNLWVRFIHVKMVVSILENLKEVLNMGLGLAHYHFSY